MPPPGSAALTTTTCALSPCRTGFLTPVIVHPDPACDAAVVTVATGQRDARFRIGEGRQRGPVAERPAGVAPADLPNRSQQINPPGIRTPPKYGSGASARPSLGHHHHGLDRPSAHPAIGLRERQAEQPELGELLPHLRHSIPRQWPRCALRFSAS